MTKLSKIITLLKQDNTLISSLVAYLIVKGINATEFMLRKDEDQFGIVVSWLVDTYNIQIDVDKFFTIVRFFSNDTEEAKIFMEKHNKVAIYGNLDKIPGRQTLLEGYIFGVEKAVNYIINPF